MNLPNLSSRLVFTLSTVMMSTALLHAEESFQPDGKWMIHSQNSCSGSSTYSHLPGKRPVSVKGGDFICSSYLPKNKLPSKDELSLQYDPTTRAVRLSGGASGFPRTIYLDKDKVGVSTTKLFPRTIQQSPGCDVMSYDLETIKFTSSNQMLYGFVTVHEIVPRHGKGCDAYLSELKTAIQRRTATGLLLAMRDIHALSVNQMKNLAAMNVFENYIGTRQMES
jgi:hypothetical protein